MVADVARLAEEHKLIPPAVVADLAHGVDTDTPAYVLYSSAQVTASVRADVCAHSKASGQAAQGASASAAPCARPGTGCALGGLVLAAGHASDEPALFKDERTSKLPSTRFLPRK